MVWEKWGVPVSRNGTETFHCGLEHAHKDELPPLYTEKYNFLALFQQNIGGNGFTWHTLAAGKIPERLNTPHCYQQVPKRSAAVWLPKAPTGVRKHPKCPLD